MFGLLVNLSFLNKPFLYIENTCSAINKQFLADLMPSFVSLLAIDSYVSFSFSLIHRTLSNSLF